MVSETKTYAVGDVLTADLDRTMVMEDHESRMELDSHANMPVIGSQAYIINWSGKLADVSPFTPDYKTLKDILLVDAAILYICPYTGSEAILVIRNALYLLPCNTILYLHLSYARLVLHSTTHQRYMFMTHQLMIMP